MSTVDKYAPIRTKKIRGNNQPFMNRTLSKEFMKRSKLKNNYNKNPSLDNKSLYNKQRNFCVNLLKREKRRYYNNLDLNIFKDNKVFWKRIKPLFSEKSKNLPKNISIVDGGTLFTDKKKVAEKLNNFFIEAVKNLDIEHVEGNDDEPFLSNDIDEIISYYESHPSVLKIKENVNVENNFAFSDISSHDFESMIKDLNQKKASIENDLPVKLLVNSSDIISGKLCEIYNVSKNCEKYPNSMKLADVIPIHKHNETTLLKNYRPVSLLPIVSKIFERKMSNEIITYIEKHLSPYIFGYRKGHSTEQCLLLMVEMWKKAMDKKRVAGSVLTDLSKAFDCLNHDLLIAKLSAYGFDKSALKFIYSYLKDRKQRTKVIDSYSTWRELLCGVPQGSILGPLLFNIFINDIFFFIDKVKIANYADDNSAYATHDIIENLLKVLEEETSVILNWFRINKMKSNDDKCKLIVAKTNNVSVTVGNETIEASDNVRLLGVNMDNELKFNDHVSKLCKKGNQKLHALARISKYLDSDKLKIIMRTFITSQFNYCPLVWMFHNRTMNNKINRLHERALRIVYKDKNLSFQELLDKDGAVSIHHRNLQKLATEMYKVKHKLVPGPILELFEEQQHIHDLRNKRQWQIPNIKTVSYGRESLRYRGPLTWELLPHEIKESESLDIFKRKVKSWEPRGCTCRLCKTYIFNLGFIN